MSNGDVSALDIQAVGGDPADLVQAFNVDFVLNVGGEPLLDTGGVPFGDPETAGYVGLADYLRSGGDPESYIATVNATSTADILRSGGDSPGFDPAVYNPNPPGVPSDWNITDVFKSITSGIAALGGTAVALIGATKSPSSGQRAASGAPAGQSLAQRLFGVNPGASGNVPSALLWGGMLAVVAFLGFAMIRKA